MAGVNPWDKQPNESRQAFEAFRLFRDLPQGTRSLQRVVSDLTKSRSLISQWANKWDWWDRVADFDAYQDRVRLELRLRSIADHEEQTVKAANAVIFKGLKALEDLDPKDLSPNQLLNYILEGTRLKRLALGEPEKIEERREKIEATAHIDIEATVEKIGPALQRLMDRGALDKPDLKIIERDQETG